MHSNSNCAYARTPAAQHVNFSCVVRGESFRKKLANQPPELNVCSMMLLDLPRAPNSWFDFTKALRKVIPFVRPLPTEVFGDISEAKRPGPGRPVSGPVPAQPVARGYVTECLVGSTLFYTAPTLILLMNTPQRSRPKRRNSVQTVL